MMLEVKPMLAESVSSPSLVDWDQHIAEIKLDVVRCIAELNRQTRLWARSGAEITHKFPELAHAHLQARPCVLDGEIVAADMTFESVQRRIHKEKPLGIRIASRHYPVIYWVFDILHLSSDDLSRRPLQERKAILWDSFDSDCAARLLPHSRDGVALFAQVRQMGMEGIMAKRARSTYQQGKRSRDWLKIKTFQEAEFLICGLTEGENERAKTFGSLILGKRENGKLLYVGNCGSGFSEQWLKSLRKTLEYLKGNCPFQERLDVGREVLFWTDPVLKAEVRFLAYEGDKLRFPTFRQKVLRG